MSFLIYWYFVDVANSILKGYVIKSSCMLESDDGFCFSLRDFWSIIFFFDLEKIIVIFIRKLNEVCFVFIFVFFENFIFVFI